MGVHGLWELLAPVGRRVSVESLGSRRLAIDASIWIIQFMKAMRDDRGDMIRNAHLLGFFRRICKLLFLRIKPVFVFDGGTPALKRRTVIARRRLREQAQSRIRKTAEKLLLNHLRTRKLDEIAGKSGPQTSSMVKDNNNDKDVSTLNNGMNGSEDLSSVGASVGAAHGDLHKLGSGDALQEHEVQEMNSWNEVETQHLDEEDEEEELVYLPSTEGKLDPAVLASLPASMQLDLLVQMREQLVAENRHKFQKVAKAPSSFSQLQIEAYLKTVAFRRGINEAQKAAAGQGVGGVPSTRIASETNREFIFSTSYQGDKTALTGEGGGNPMLPGLKPPEPKVQPPAVNTSTLLSTNFRSLPPKEGTLITELDEDENPDSSVQTYVDEKGRTRVSRVRGMGVRMTRDLQWNLYLMKDVEKRQALEEPKNDNVSAFAESLVNNGDGEIFQRLMIGDNVSVSESLSGVPSKQHGESVYSLNDASLEANQSMHDRGSHNDSAVGAGQKAVVSPDVMPQLSSIQITFNSNEDVEDEDLDMFKNLVGDEAGTPLEKPQELKPSSGLAAVAEENEDDDCEWEDGDCQGVKEVDLGLKGSNAVEELDQQNRSHTQPDGHTPTPNDLSFAGDSDLEMALAIQESLAEHDRLRSSQPGVYPDSEDTGLSDDSDTGDSGESEVEWEDGSGAVAVPAVGYTVTGLALTQEELEFQEATRRSLDDVASWRAPVRALPQLVIREPVEGAAKTLSGSVPRVGEQEAVATFDRSLQMDSEEARIARERARKGKAVADETVVLPPVGVIRTTVSQAGLESAVSLPQEKVDGRGEVQAQPQGLPSLDGRLVASVGAGKEDFPGQNPSQAHEDKNVSHLNGSKVNDSVTVLAYNHDENKEVGSDLVKQNLKSLSNGTKSNAEPSIDTGTEVSQFPEIRSIEKPGIIEMPEILEGVKPVPDAVEKGAKGSSPLSGQHDTLSSVANPNFVKPSSESVFAMEDMLKDAEEMDMAKEREEMLKHEAELLAEREALARDEAELQAALEKEQEELLAGIEKERELLHEEEAELREMQKKNERNADSVTSEMFAECQELLQMFGIPYVIAPMEAEAQCAFLDAEKLVDGVVTDDVDVFLFGGRNVYKNIFDDRKYVETYYMKDVETDLGLTRDKLVQMALLLGSDYTEGISGIGIVNAIEVVNAFDEEDGLKKFKELVESVDLSLLGLEGTGSKRKGSQGKAKGAGDKGKKGGTDDTVEKDDSNEGAELAGNGNGPGDTERALRQEAFMENHRAVSKNWRIPESFPSEAVVAEYKGPRVDKSKQSFSWGRPDLEALRKFCFERFSWPKDKADELLLSVLKEYDRRETQLRMDAFYSFNQRFAKVRSARIQKALRGTTGRLSKEMVDIPSPEGGPPAKKQRQKKSTGKKSAERIATDLVEEEADLNTVEGSGRGSEDLVSGQGNGRGKGKKKKETVSGRGRGRGRGRSSGVSIELEDDSSAHSSESDHDIVEIETENRPDGLKRKSDDQLLPVRRSSRARRNEANYQEPAGSDDGKYKSESEDDTSLRSESSDPLQPANTENQLEINIDDQAVAGHNDGDVHRSTEKGADSGTAALPKLYLFSGGGFCLPDEEEDEISAGLKDRHQLDEGIQPELHGNPNEVFNGHLGPSQHSTVDPVTNTPGLPTEDQVFTQTETQSTAAEDVPVKTAQVDASVGNRLRAMPFLRRKRPPKQP